MRKAVIIVPTYNEAGNILSLVSRIFKSTETLTNWDIQILFVDSKSQDETGPTIEEIQKSNPKVHLLVTEKEGLGKAYVNGFRYAIEELKAFVVFEMDADLSHEPERIPDFLKQIEQGADFVIGSRYMEGGSIPTDWGIHRKIFSRTANLFVKFGFMKPKITDWTGGYRAMKIWVVKDAMNHISKYSGYVFQIALLDYAIKHNARIAETPIQFKERQYGISKINALQYIVQTVIYVLTKSPFVRFVIVGGIGFILDFSITYVGINMLTWAVWTTTLLSTESAIISNFFLNNFWAFSHKKLDQSGLKFAWSFLKFNFISAGSIVIQTVGMQVASSYFGRELWYAYKIAIILVIVIPYSYILYNKFIWKE